MLSSHCLVFAALCLLSFATSQEDDAPLTPKWKEVVTVDHSYYQMNLYKDNTGGTYDKHVVDMSRSRVHDFLSNHSQAAEAVAPGFDFPFYGHTVDRFFITTHGFLSFAPRLHNLMYKTQYVAPLRVKLDPSLSEYATLNYLSMPEKLTIQWTHVTVAKAYAHPEGGNFTFQVSLHKNGDIDFVYIDIPELLTADALYDHEPVAGLSDAFLIGDSELHVYHTLNVDNPDIMSKTVVLFKAKPTCIQQESCEECAQLGADSEFECSWCPSIHRCSDGADRLREHWNASECSIANVTSVDMCGKGNAHHTEWRSSMNDDGFEGEEEENGAPLSEPISSDNSYNGNTADVGTIISVVVSLVLVLVVIGLLAAFLYMYGSRNPGGMAERIAMRMESNYKKFGGDVEMDKPEQEESNKEEANKKNSQNNNNNDGSITVSF